MKQSIKTQYKKLEMFEKIIGSENEKMGIVLNPNSTTPDRIKATTEHLNNLKVILGIK